MRAKIFIAVQKIIDQGGISTSIVNLLNEIHSLYDVTLCATDDYISPNVHLPGDVKIVRGSQYIGDAITDRRLLASQGFFRKVRRNVVRFVRRRKGMEWIIARGIRDVPVPDTEYDAAVAFTGCIFHDGHVSNGGDYELVLGRVRAHRKVAWVHNDIRQLGYNHDIALKVFRDFDAIVTVSHDNKRLVDEMVPEYTAKSVVVYNTYNLRHIIESADRPSPYPNNGKMHFVTVARLSLQQKRQDRIIKACGRLKKEGFTGFDWTLVGDGERETLEQIVDEQDVRDIITFTGLQSNPYPYMKHADAFVLTSLYEGYGMTMKESHTLGVPVLVTNVGSAHEAVKDGYEGRICDNSTEGVYNMIKHILQHPEELQTYRAYLAQHPVSNELALRQFAEVCGVG